MPRINKGRLGIVVAALLAGVLAARIVFDPETSIFAPAVLPDALEAAETYSRGQSHAGRVALVTGGASGIGFHVAQALAHIGYRVVILGRNPHEGAAAVAAITGANASAQVEFQRCDLAVRPRCASG